MKKIKTQIIIVVMMLIAFELYGSSYFNTLTNLWHTGHQTNVLQMAQSRLVSNTNDIAGILMKASWDFAFSDAETLSNSLVRIRSVGGQVVTPAFTNAFVLTQFDLDSTFSILPRLTPAQLAIDRVKASGSGHRMHYEEELKALDDDGFFNGE